MKDKLIFTVAAEEVVIGWEIEREHNQIVTAKKAIGRIAEALGISGLESFIGHAIKEGKLIDIIIADEYGTESTSDYDPCGESKEPPIVLFTAFFGECLEFFMSQSSKNELSEFN